MYCSAHYVYLLASVSDNACEKMVNILLLNYLLALKASLRVFRVFFTIRHNLIYKREQLTYHGRYTNKKISDVFQLMNKSLIVMLRANERTTEFFRFFTTH